MRSPRVVFAVLLALSWGVASSSVAADGPGLAKALVPFVEEHKLAGAVVMVAGPEKVLEVEAVGFADVAAGTPMRPDALFWIASMSKPMTATALMMLVDEGKVRLDDPVGKYLPEFRNAMVEVERSSDRLVLKKPARAVTVRDILSHTAGLVGRSPLESTLDSVPLRDAAISYGMSPLKFEPGSKYEYCNPGINTAGRIIEVVAGMPYETFLQNRLLDPLGMKDTTFWPTAEQVARLAKSYQPDPKGEGLREIPIGQLRYPLDRPITPPVPGRRAVLDRGGLRDVLPIDPQRRRPPRRPARLGGFRPRHDLDADWQLAQ